MNTKSKNIFCNNCGKLGHLFHQCKLPITSIGIIALRIVNNQYEVLLIKRKDSLSFVDFLRGKYTLEDNDYIINLLNNMTVKERNFIKNNDFETLWNYLWNYNSNTNYKNEEKSSLNKFNTLKNGFINNNKKYYLDNLINACNKNYCQPEWGFPKGRRNFQEKDIMCAIREFEEETGYSKSNIKILNNVVPFEEIFTGSNYKSYKHKYYLCLFNNNFEPDNLFQLYEINKIEWVNINNVNEYFRDYNYEKKNIINQLINLLKTYKLYI